MLTPEADGYTPEMEGSYNLGYQDEEVNLGRERNGIKHANPSEVNNGQIATSAIQQSTLNADSSFAFKKVSFSGNSDMDVEIKQYKKRFWMLGLFSVCSMLNGMQWVQYTVVSDVTECFYGVDIYAVNWTANLYLILYAPLVFPVSWLTDKIGVKKALLIGSLLTTIGTLAQCGANTPDKFHVVLISQTFASVGQVFILALPPCISAIWFGANEVSRASAVGVFGNQLGCALGFVFTPLVMSKDCSNIPLVMHGKQIIAYTLVACNLVVFLLILATFKDRPETPPSLAQAKKTIDEKDYKRSIRALFKNINYDLLLVSYGIIVGAYFAVSTVLNSLVSKHFPGKDTEIGWMGLIAILSGTVGSVIAGYILDFTHRFREISIIIFVLTFLSMILFSGLLYVDLLWLQFLTIAIFGFFLTSYLPVGFEFAVEITYPESEAISAQLLNASTMAIGFIFTIIASYLLEKYNDVVTNIFFCTILFIGCIITAIIKGDFRRQQQSIKELPA